MWHIYVSIESSHQCFYQKTFLFKTHMLNSLLAFCFFWDEIDLTFWYKSEMHSYLVGPDGKIFAWSFTDNLTVCVGSKGFDKAVVSSTCL